MSSILPCIGLTGGIMNKFISTYMQCVLPPTSFSAQFKLFYFRLSLKQVAEGGSIAEEVIATIRTAQAFGTQNVLARLYNDRIDAAHKVDMKAAVWHGGGLASFFFVIYAAYALGEYSFEVRLYSGD